MGKVKAQPVRRYQGTLLGHMLAQHFPQRSVQQVCGRVVAHRVDARDGVDPGRHLLPGLQGPAAYPAQVHVSVSLLLRIFDREYARI